MSDVAREVLFVDQEARRWRVIDFRVIQDRKKRVPIGDWRGEGRAFVPDGWTGDVLCYRFGLVVYRTTEPKILANQLMFARPMPASGVP